MVENNQRKSKSAQGSRLDREAVSLFGTAIYEQSKRIGIDALAIEAEQVAEGARQLREQMGKPDRQRAIIEAMDDETAIALCKWIMQPDCMTGYIAMGMQ